MEIGTMLGDAFEYTKESLVGKWIRWLILLVGTIIFPIILGYTLRIYRGEQTPPDPQDWVAVFIDGIKLFVVQLVYAIPIIIVSIAINLAILLPFNVVSGEGGTMNGGIAGAAIAMALVLALVQIVLSIAISLISMMASVRFARADSFGEAFNISAILAHIGRIGWGSYILALIVLYLVLFAVVVVLVILGVLTLGLGFLLFLALTPAFSIFTARYVTLIYDSAPAPA
ncbi:MAG: DUF4013 domain-containing protein [Methanospirillum sp.]